MEWSVNEIGDGLVYCPACGNYSDITTLGVLGARLWFRCRECGREWSDPIEVELWTSTTTTS